MSRYYCHSISNLSKLIEIFISDMVLKVVIIEYFGAVKLYFNMTDETQAELNRLNTYHQICCDALNEFAANNPYKLPAYEKEKIEKLLHRLFDGETDYLLQNPEDYLGLYGHE